MLVSDNPGEQNYIHPGGRKKTFFVIFFMNSSDFISWKTRKTNIKMVNM